MGDVPRSPNLSNPERPRASRRHDRPPSRQRPRGHAWGPAGQADLLADAIARLGLDRPVVVGHSWGTMVALALALRHPGRVGGLVLVSGHFFPTVRIDALLSVPTTVPLVGDVLAHTVAPILGAAVAWPFVRLIFAPRRVSRRFAEDFPVGLSLRPRQLRAMAADTVAMVPAAAAMARRYGSLRLPVAILAGADDRIVDPHRQSARLHRAIPGSTLRIAAGVGHMLHHADPDAVVAAVEGVASTTGRSSIDR